MKARLSHKGIDRYFGTKVLANTLVLVKGANRYQSIMDISLTRGASFRGENQDKHQGTSFIRGAPKAT